MTDFNPQQGALERLNIPVETTPPEGVMTAGKARSIRFRTSHPTGYAFGDVESFIFEYLIPTLEWYADALYQRDLAVHKLGELIDKLEVDVLNLHAQLDNKQYNDAIGLAVDEADKDEEVEFLLGRIKTLETELEAARAGQVTAQDAPIVSPEGEYYTREQVEEFIASAVADAESRYAGYYSPEQVQTLLAEAVANAQANAATPEGEYYTREEVEGFIATAVAEAQAEATSAAPAPAPEVQGYTQEELEAAVAEAVAQKEKEILASLPEERKPQDSIDELTDEGDLNLRAEVKTLRTALGKMDTYTKELEAYIAQLEGRPAGVGSNTSQPTSQDGRPLPKIRPEDL